MDCTGGLRQAPRGHVLETHIFDRVEDQENTRANTVRSSLEGRSGFLAPNHQRDRAQHVLPRWKKARSLRLSRHKWHLAGKACRSGIARPTNVQIGCRKREFSKVTEEPSNLSRRVQNS